jgi:hypothetical protein
MICPEEHLALVAKVWARLELTGLPTSNANASAIGSFAGWTTCDHTHHRRSAKFF